MAVDILQDTVGASWKAVTPADGEYHVTAEAEVRYVIGTTPPAADFKGHMLPAGDERNFVLDTGRFLYIKSLEGPADVFLTKSW